MKFTENIHKTINAAGQPLKWCEHEIARYIEPFLEDYFSDTDEKHGKPDFADSLIDAINNRWDIWCHYRTSPGGFEASIFITAHLPSDGNPDKMYFGTWSVQGFKIEAGFPKYWESYKKQKKDILRKVARYIIDEKYIEGDPEVLDMDPADIEDAMDGWMAEFYFPSVADNMVQDIFVRPGSPFAGKFQVEKQDSGLPLNLGPEVGITPDAPIVINFFGK